MKRISNPDFVIVGAAKAGTTSLYEYCRQHPGIFVVPRKEPRFFAFEGKEVDPNDPVHSKNVTDLVSYLSLFDDALPGQITGEASPVYLIDEETPSRIAGHKPDAKIVVILRNPVERAYSHFLYAQLGGLEPMSASFEDVLHEPTVNVGQWVRRRRYLETGFYFQHLSRYIAVFGRDRIHISFFEDLVRDPVKLAQDVFRFLGVDDSFVPSASVKFGKSGIPKNKLLHSILYPPGLGLIKTVAYKMMRPKDFHALRARRIKIVNRNLSKEPMSALVRKELTELFRDDVCKLEKLVHRDLSSWLS